MKQAVKVSRVISYLEIMFRQLNQDKFDGQLPDVIITVQSTPGAYGHVTCAKVWKSQTGREQYELNIGAGTLNRPIENVVATLLHEMVHIYHLENGVKDCSRGCTYHNKHFRDKATSVGLQIDYHERIGWSITSPTESLIDYIIGQGWQEFSLYRDEPLRIRTGSGSHSASPAPSTGKSSSTRKYQCPHCGNSCRATKDINILCMDCNIQMRKV